MKTLEDCLEALEKKNQAIEKLLGESKLLVKEIRSRPDEDWDWVSVQTASKKLDVSQAMIYQRLHRGQLGSKRFGGKIFVSLKELKAVNDVKI